MIKSNFCIFFYKKSNLKKFFKLFIYNYKLLHIIIYEQFFKFFQI